MSVGVQGTLFKVIYNKESAMGSKKIKMLTLEEELRVIDWIKSIVKNGTRFVSAKAAADAASEQLGMQVCLNAFERVRKAINVPLDAISTRGSGARPQNGAVKNLKLRVIAREIIRIQRELGLEVTDDLHAISRSAKMPMPQEEADE